MADSPRPATDPAADAPRVVAWLAGQLAASQTAGPVPLSAVVQRDQARLSAHITQMLQS